MSTATEEASTSEQLTPKSGEGGGDSKKRDIDVIRKNLAKRSFHVKFDLDDTDYQAIENIGIGAYGVVCSAIHKKANEKVAIKKIPCVFEALDIAKRTYREIKILRHFKHDNIISIREILKPKESYHEFKDIYVVFDLMESDLHRIIYSEQPLTEEHIRYFLYQILRGLKYIHSANVVHRDLKPSNLLVNEDCHVRIGDFGMARGVNSQREEPSHYMTQYVATRWYRAPEILLSLLEYGTAVDMWSVGCIFAEMLGRKHLFPGKDYLAQVKLVLGVLGTPSDVVIKQCQSDVLRRIIKSFGHRQPIPWTTLFPKASKKAIDLLSKMLIINPADRITVQRALQHPFLSKYHDPDDEPICVPSFEFDFEKELFHMDRDHLRELIYKEVMDFHQPRTPTLSFSACLRPAPKPGEASATETNLPLSFKDQLQSYMSSFTQAESSQEKKPEEGLQPAVQQSIIASFASAVPVTTSTATADQQDVFKKPPDRASKKSPVSVDTGNLKLPAMSDIEMLSAQSTASSVAMDTMAPQTPLVEKQETEKEKKPAEKKVAETKTISEDTKALVKQALLSHRQRTESCGEEDKPRPVTAAQRQREREEKRRKKKEREKMKKVHDKKGTSQEPELSDADKELLARWQTMQKAKSQAETKQTGTVVTSTAAGAQAPTVVYLQQNYPATPSPPQAASGFSPPHPGPASTPPSILPGSFVSQGSPGQGMTSQQDVQLSQIPSLAQGRITVAAGQQVGARTSLPEDQLVSFVDMARNAGTQLCLTSSQAEAIKEALKLQNVSIVQTSHSGASPDNVLHRQVPTPPHTVADVNSNSTVDEGKANFQLGGSDQNNQLFTNAQTSSNFFSQPDMNQQGFAQTGGQGAGSSQSNAGSSNPDPQDLAEFLDRHCKSEDNVVSSDRGTGNFAASAMFHTSNVKPFPLRPKSETLAPCGGNSFTHRPKSDTLASCSVSKQTWPNGPGLFGNIAGGEQVSMPSQHTKTETVHGSLSFPNMPDGKGFFMQQNRAASDCSLETRQGQSGVVIGNSGFQGMPQNQQQPYFMQANTGVNFPSSNHTQNVQFGQVSSGAVGQVSGSVMSQMTEDNGLRSESGSLQRFASAVSQIQSASPYPQFVQSTPPSQTVDVKSGLRDPVGFGLNQTSQMQQSHVLGTGDGQMGQTSHFHPEVQSQHGDLPQQQQLHHHHHQNQQQYTGMLQQQNYSPSTSHQEEVASSQDSQQEARGSRAPGLRVSAPVQDPSADLLALIKQMSKSQLDTILPPCLSLTPRGTGGGYGVGMDLDVLMADTVDNSGAKNELSPLSSSLLADWIEMTGNISQADLDALEQDFSMTSPVSMPFTDYQNPSNEGSWS